MRAVERRRRSWILVPILAVAGLTGTARGSIPEDPNLWVARYNGPANLHDFATSVAVSPDGSKVFVTGDSDGSSGGSSDYATVAYAAAGGSQLWAARYNGPANNDDFATSLAVSPDGSKVYVTGESPGSGSSSDYATVAYAAAGGSQLWAARYNGPANSDDFATSLAVSPDGSKVFVTGGSDIDGYYPIYDYATIAYDAAGGSQLWAAHYNGPANYADFATSLAVSPDGSKVFVTGYSDDPFFHEGYATVAYDAASGSQLWAARYNDPANYDFATSLAVSPDGSKVFVTGYSYVFGSHYDYATVAYDAGGGSQLWAARYNGPGDSVDLATSLAVSPDGSKVFVTGPSTGSVSRADYATIAYAAASGSQLWAARYNEDSNDFATSVAVSPDGSKVFVTGASYGSDGTYDYTTIAYRKTSCANGADEAGPVSATVHSAVEDQAGPGAPYVHGPNCDVVAANGL